MYSGPGQARHLRRPKGEQDSARPRECRLPKAVTDDQSHKDSAAFRGDLLYSKKGSPVSIYRTPRICQNVAPYCSAALPSPLFWELCLLTSCAAPPPPHMVAIGTTSVLPLDRTPLATVDWTRGEHLTEAGPIRGPDPGELGRLGPRE